MRSILHINIDSFFAGVERKRRPELCGKPIIVGRPKGNTSGMVVSASAEVRKAGVEEGMSVRQAQRACPDAVVLRADYATYRQVSQIFLDILARYSPLLEPDSLGSAYIDVTASRNLFGDWSQIGARIASQISERLDLPLSIGCASNRLLAKIASSCPTSPWEGVRGRLTGFPITQIPTGSEISFLSPLPINMLDAVSGKIEKRLRELGVPTIGQLAEIDERLLVRQFGPVGSLIKKQSLGMDSSLVKAAYPCEIIMIEHRFDHEAEEPAEIEAHLREMACDAQMNLRKRGGLAGEVTLKLFDESAVASQLAGVSGIYCAGVSGIYSRNCYVRFKKPTASASTMLQSLVKLLDSKMKPGMRISRVQVVLSDLRRGDGLQLCLIGDGERRRRLDGAIELIRERFGERSVCLATSLIPAGRARVLSRIAA